MSKQGPQRDSAGCADPAEPKEKRKKIRNCSVHQKSFDVRTPKQRYLDFWNSPEMSGIVAHHRKMLRDPALRQHLKAYAVHSDVFGTITCGAQLEDGGLCTSHEIWPPNGRCKVHGGMSTGPTITRRSAQAKALAVIKATPCHDEPASGDTKPLEV